MCHLSRPFHNPCGTPARRSTRSGSSRTSPRSTLGDEPGPGCPCLREACSHAGFSSREVLMSHVVLLGDSVFDNAAYVPDRPPVIEQVRRGLPLGWKATLVAVDGHTIKDIATQLPRVPVDATHLVV